MKFGPVPIREAEGGIVAHALRAGDLVLRKGTVVTRTHVDALAAAGVAEAVVARPEPGDLGEDEAAHAVAAAAAGEGVRLEDAFTGRCNLFATVSGVLVVDRARIDAANAIDEAITFATLDAMKPVSAGEMIATAKIIPFSVPEGLALQAAEALKGAVSVRAFRQRRTWVISTLLPGLKASVVAKTEQALADRLARLGQQGAPRAIRVEHGAEPLAEALRTARAEGADLIIVFGASAITDRRDVIPAAIEVAGGRIEHFGMPVDPGNLLLIGALGGADVIGAPGCARSPRENGFDWVLQRLCAGIAVTRADIQRMGVGGLLMEIFSRPQPRSPQVHAPAPRIGAVVLAAGSSRRMGRNKLLEPLADEPVVRHVARAALATRAAPVVVVTGHEDEAVRAALDGLEVSFAHNGRHLEGMAGSLLAGLDALPEDCAAAVVLLGDMPLVTAAIIDRLIDNFAAQPGALAVTPVAEGRRANPVLVSRALFAAARELAGDVGLRGLLNDAGESVIEVPVEQEAVLLDVDTPEAMERARALIEKA